MPHSDAGLYAISDYIAIIVYLLNALAGKAASGDAHNIRSGIKQFTRELGIVSVMSPCYYLVTASACKFTLRWFDMKKTGTQLAEWAVRKVESDFRDDVCLPVSN